MQVIVTDELWISTQEDGSMILHTPTIPGAPGLMQNPPHVLPPGTVLLIHIDRPMVKRGTRNERLDAPSQAHKVQEIALERSSRVDKYAYFMEMGLGKTAVVLADFLRLYEGHEIDDLLVICPNSLKGTWAEEVIKMGVPSEVPCYLWPYREWEEVLLNGAIYVMNYEAMSTPKGQEFLDIFFDHDRRIFLVFDESISIKNPRAKRTKAAIKLSKRAKHVRILSGAPVVQGPQDLWAQMRCLGLFNSCNFWVFRNRYCKMGGYLGKQVVGYREDTIEELNSILSAISFRATKDEWIDIPKKIYTTRHVELESLQKAHYKNMKEELLTVINGVEIDVQMAITKMIKLQQISSGFIIDGQGSIQAIDCKNPKVKIIEEIMEETTGKVLIFTWFRESTRILQEVLVSYRPAVMMGGMSPELIEAQKTRFNEEPLCRVIIVQIQTGKYGHTLLGGSGNDRCATTVFYENSFSLDSRLQAEDRNHRIGQDRSVVYIDLVASDIDRVMVRALQKKQDIATAILSLR